MKTLKSIILAVAVLFATGTVNANTLAKHKAILTRDYTLTTYINAIAHGKTADLAAVVDNNVTFSIKRGDQKLDYTKDQMLEFLKGTKGVEQDCTTTTTDMESNTDQAVVKVDMKYKGFTRTNYVTVTNTNDGWKITSVYVVIKNA